MKRASLIALALLLTGCYWGYWKSHRLIAKTSRTAEPPIPRLAQWEAQMTQYGTVTCNHFVAQGVNFGTYYDGLKSMELIRAYREAAGAPASELATWNACSDTANDVYRDGYVLMVVNPGPGGVPGYNEFTDGLRIHFNRTAEADSRKTVAYMAGFHLIDQIGRGAAYCAGDYNQTAISLQREVAYCMKSVLNWGLLGGDPQTTKRTTILANMKTQVAKRIGTRLSPAPTQLPHADIGTVCSSGHPETNMYVQPFMLAIQAHSLMLYYDQIAQDPTVLETIRWIADWSKANAYDPVAKAFWYENCGVYGTPITWIQKAGAADLNLFYVDMYEWLYRLTCDTSYRDFADTLFDEGVRTGPTSLPFDGKHFNQQYASGSFDYVAWRKLPTPAACSTVAIPNVPGQPAVLVEVKP